jgi:hypothetical protein
MSRLIYLISNQIIITKSLLILTVNLLKFWLIPQALLMCVLAFYIFWLNFYNVRPCSAACLRPLEGNVLLELILLCCVTISKFVLNHCCHVSACILVMLIMMHTELFILFNLCPRICLTSFCLPCPLHRYLSSMITLHTSGKCIMILHHKQMNMMTFLP